MRILLISPPLSATDRYGKELGKVAPATEPLGLAYLAAAIKEKRKNKDEIEILDTIVLNYNSTDIENYINKNNFDLIGITMLTPMYAKAKETVKIAKQFSKAKIIVGGPHVTIMPIETLKDIPEIDIGVYGECELTIVELLDALEKKISLSKIEGIVYRKGEKIIINKPRELIKNLDDIPIPARDLLPMKKYVPAPTYYKRLPSYIILTSRGCPYRCVYCSKIFGSLYRHHSVERVIKEMKLLINKYKAREIIFRDDTFTINKKYVEELCKRIIKERLNKKIQWTCMTRVNLVDYNLLKLMRKAGCWSIHYGIETGSQRLLNLIQKDVTIEQCKNAIKWTRKVGIETKTFFMLGLPTETKEESLQTIRFTKELDPDWIQVTITVPYPGTVLYELAKKDGTLKSLKWEEYQTWAGWANGRLVYVPSNRNEDELKELQKRAMREFYFRPKTIIRLLLQLRSLEMLKKYFMGAKALYKSKFRR